MNNFLQTINLLGLTKNITEQHSNFIVSEVNDHCLRIAVFTGEYKWHYHPDSDELFMVVEGELLIDLKDQETAVLGPNDTLLIPAGTVHRTRSNVRTINLCFEKKDAATVLLEE